MTEQEYIPFGDEWKKEVMTHSKEQLVNWWKKSLQKIIELESDRDKFAMEFAEWIGTDQCPYEIEGAKTDAEIVKGYLDLFKQSLKTDNK